jgi:hypothetical protein
LDTSSNTCLYCNNSINYFLNAAQQCVLCSLTGCQTCASLSVCNICSTGYTPSGTTCTTSGTTPTCNTTSNYYLDTVSNTCLFCDPLLNKFIDTLTLQCVTCSMTGCTACTSLSACASCNTAGGYILSSGVCTLSNGSNPTCNTAANYYLNTTLKACMYCDASLNKFIDSTLQCVSCSLTGCLTCSSLSTCTSCDTISGYTLISGSCSTSPSTCTLAGCLACSSLSSCSSCDTVNFYLLDPITNLCTYNNPSIIPVCGDNILSSST